MSESPGWQSWDEPAKEQLKLRAAEQCARIGMPTPAAERYATPGQLALACSDKVVQRPHMAVIDKGFADVKAGNVDRLLIVTPPQVGKTSRVAWGVFWWMTLFPNNPIILASYASALAATRGLMVRTLVENYGGPFGLVKDHAQWARNHWQTTSGAVMYTGGMDSGLTGNPAAAVVIDDPHKNRAEAESEDMRKKVWDTYSSSVLSRLRPGGPLILVQTRWHPDDLAGRVLKEEGAEHEGGRWRVAHMEAIATGKVIDPLGRSPGQPLTHPFIAEGNISEALRHWEEKKRTSTLRDWAALYQGDPVPAEGALLTEDQVKAARHRGDLPPARMIGVGVDPSGGGRDTAGIVGGMQGTDGRLYWTHDRSGPMSSEMWSREACLLAFEIGADRIIYEHNYGGDAMKLAIRTAWEALQREHAKLREEAAESGEPKPEGLIPGDAMCPRIIGKNSKRGKLLRADPVAQQILEDNARFAGLELLDFEKEWTSFQADSKDSPGRLDAGVHLAYDLIKVPGAEVVVSTVKDRPKLPTGTSRTARRRIDRG